MTTAVFKKNRATPQEPSRLHYSTAGAAGYRRIGSLKAFRYRKPDGKFVTRASEIERIRKLAIPPAWTNVWISASPQGHLQATGRDARGRKQYRYHAVWRERQEQTKFQHMLEFGVALPRLRRQVARDLHGAPDSRRTVLAAVVRLLELTLIRVGNEEYVRQNHSYGLSTLRNRHVRVRGKMLQFHFRGKSGRMHQVEVHDRRVAAVVRRLHDLPGQELFQYRNTNGHLVSLTSGDVNDYLRHTTGRDITAKDFRTWAASLEAARLLGLSRQRDTAWTKRSVNIIIADIAAKLGNTPAICRRSYVHPELIVAYLKRDAEWPMNGDPEKSGSRAKRAFEKSFMRFLRALRRKKPASLSQSLERSIEVPRMARAAAG